MLLLPLLLLCCCCCCCCCLVAVAAVAALAALAATVAALVAAAVAATVASPVAAVAATVAAPVAVVADGLAAVVALAAPAAVATVHWLPSPSPARHPGPDPRRRDAQERAQPVVLPPPRLHLPHGGDGGVDVVREELAAAHGRVPISKTVRKLVGLLLKNKDGKVKARCSCAQPATAS